jgi:hypothetical protein
MLPEAGQASGRRHVIRDDEGILSSILYGPDLRTRLTSETRAAIFTTYAPTGILQADLQTHLSDLEANVRLFSPRAEVEVCEVFRTG